MKALTTLYPVSSLNPALVHALQFHAQPETHEQWAQHLYQQMDAQQWDDFIEGRERYQRDEGAHTGSLNCAGGDVFAYRLICVDGVNCVQVTQSPVLERFATWRNEGMECDGSSPSDAGLWGYALTKTLMEMNR